MDGAVLRHREVVRTLEVVLVGEWEELARRGHELRVPDRVPRDVALHVVPVLLAVGRLRLLDAGDVRLLVGEDAEDAGELEEQVVERDEERRAREVDRARARDGAGVERARDPERDALAPLRVGEEVAVGRVGPARVVDRPAAAVALDAVQTHRCERA